MTWLDKKLDTHKRLMINTKTGEKRLVVEDQEHRESVARGDTLQPVGRDKQEFLDKYPRYRENHQGEIINKELETDRIKNENKEFLEKEKEKFAKRDKIHKKWY